MIKILKGWFRTAFLVLDFASVCTIGEEAALGVGGGGGQYCLVSDCQARTGTKGTQINGMLSIKRLIFNDVSFDLNFWAQMDAKLQLPHRISLGDPKRSHLCLN